MSAQPDRAHREPLAEDGTSAIGLTGDALLEACPWPERRIEAFLPRLVRRRLFRQATVR